MIIRSDIVTDPVVVEQLTASVSGALNEAATALACLRCSSPPQAHSNLTSADELLDLTCTHEQQHQISSYCEQHLLEEESSGMDSTLPSSCCMSSNAGVEIFQ